MRRLFTEKELDELDLNTDAPLVPFLLIVGNFQENRLRQTCFRGINLRRAGNFCFASKFEDILDESMEVIAEDILEVIQDMMRLGEPYRDSHRLTIDYEEPIGWKSTVPLSALPDSVKLKTFEPNLSTQAMRVADERVLAPSSRTLTIIFEFVFLKDGWKAIVKTVYPGEFVQMGFRDHERIIDPSEAVFFNWNHEGVPL